MKTEHAAGLILVVALHAVALYGLLQHRLIPLPQQVETLFVDFIPPPAPPRPEPRKPEPPRPARPEQPRPPEPHRHLVVEAPAAPSDFVMPLPPPPPPAPVVEAPPLPPPRPVGPVTLSGELSLACPTRTPPAYPALSRRQGEAGKVVLRVELAPDGRVEAASVSSSSGYKRLDEAALKAVRGWHCNPPLRDGVPVRAVALQPFQFNLE